MCFIDKYLTFFIMSQGNISQVSTSAINDLTRVNIDQTQFWKKTSPPTYYLQIFLEHFFQRSKEAQGNSNPTSTRGDSGLVKTFPPTYYPVLQVFLQNERTPALVHMEHVRPENEQVSAST